MHACSVLLCILLVFVCVCVCVLIPEGYILQFGLITKPLLYEGCTQDLLLTLHWQKNTFNNAPGSDNVVLWILKMLLLKFDHLKESLFRFYILFRHRGGHAEWDSRDLCRVTTAQTLQSRYSLPWLSFILPFRGAHCKLTKVSPKSNFAMQHFLNDKCATLTWRFYLMCMRHLLPAPVCMYHKAFVGSCRQLIARFM